MNNWSAAPQGGDRHFCCLLD